MYSRGNLNQLDKRSKEYLTQLEKLGFSVQGFVASRKVKLIPTNRYQKDGEINAKFVFLDPLNDPCLRELIRTNKKS